MCCFGYMNIHTVDRCRQYTYMSLCLPSFFPRMTTFSIMTFQWSLWRWEACSGKPISALLNFEVKLHTLRRQMKGLKYLKVKPYFLSWICIVLSFVEIQRGRPDLNPWPQLRSLPFKKLCCTSLIHCYIHVWYQMSPFLVCAQFTSNGMGCKIRLTSILVSFQMLAASHLPDPVTFVLPSTFYSSRKLLLERHTIACKLRGHGVQPSINHSALSKLALSQDADTGWSAWLRKKLAGSTLGRERLWCGKSRCPWRSQLYSADGHALTFVDCIIFNVQYESVMELMECVYVCVSIYIYIL